MNEDQLFDRCVDELAQHNFSVLDHFVAEEDVDALCDDILRQLDQGGFKKAAIGQGDQEQKVVQIRGDHIKWINHAEEKGPIRDVADKLLRWMEFANRACFLGLKDVEMHYAVYPPGTRYARHWDQFQQDDNRSITFVLYLNKDWQEFNGGALRMYLPAQEGVIEAPQDILPKAGRCVFFCSDLIEHEVLITHRERFSLTGWFLKSPADLKFL